MTHNISENQLVGTEVTTNLMPLDMDLSARLEQTQNLCVQFEKNGIKEATSFNGDYYHHDPDSGIKTVVTEGCIVEHNENTVTITLKKADSDTLDAVSEVTGKTQKTLGAFVGKSQPWISQNKE